MPEAMRLMIFRHAKAEKGAPGMRDRDRPLATARPQGCGADGRLHGAS